MSSEGVQEILQWKWNEKEALNFFEKIKATEKFLKELDADGVRLPSLLSSSVPSSLLFALFSVFPPFLCCLPISLSVDT